MEATSTAEARKKNFLIPFWRWWCGSFYCPSKTVHSPRIHVLKFSFDEWADRWEWQAKGVKAELNNLRRQHWMDMPLALISLWAFMSWVFLFGEHNTALFKVVTCSRPRYITRTRYPLLYCEALSTEKYRRYINIIIIIIILFIIIIIIIIILLFFLLVFGTNEGMGLDCQNFLRTLANKLSTKDNKPYTSVFSWLRIQLSFAQMHQRF